ncbi:uracil phosphoribosyltransferase [bacterium]|nr:uracil phosphoribosyltransferase [bacterium]
MKSFSNLSIVTHPLLSHSMNVLRDKRTATEAFRHHSAIASRILLMEATREMPTKDYPIETPLAPVIGQCIADPVVLIPVLRAGLAMLNAAQEFMPWASVGFIGLERDERTAIASTYYRKFPDRLAHRHIIVLDPMLATGGSLIDTIDALKAQGGVKLSAVCVVAAPEGVERLNAAYPDVSIVVGALDSHLDENKYIVPGLGDFGDRYFET